ncbi:uncharacterized protein G2W53_003884 [Senna tora]|uniref:Uncharacterized protein n=1 Tax=Senna tora TaxID=362788 RepID=A0A835CG58_9FABA|nr:uncharacterized protein G2W53_003884 [Senna tora]
MSLGCYGVFSSAYDVIGHDFVKTGYSLCVFLIVASFLEFDLHHDVIGHDLHHISVYVCCNSHGDKSWSHDPTAEAPVPPVEITKMRQQLVDSIAHMNTLSDRDIGAKKRKVITSQLPRDHAINFFYPEKEEEPINEKLRWRKPYKMVLGGLSINEAVILAYLKARKVQEDSKAQTSKQASINTTNKSFEDMEKALQ